MPEVLVEQTIEIEEATIHLREDGIVHVNYKQNVEIDVDLLKRLSELFVEICGNTKRPFLFTAMDSVSITAEARRDSIKMESVFPAIVIALVASSLAHKLIANFYVKVNHPLKTYKIFDDTYEAIEWLKTFS
jgi:hypothetical protein